MTSDKKLERLIRVLERRGRKGFLFLRSAEAFPVQAPQAKALPKTAPETPQQFAAWWNAASDTERDDWFAEMTHDRLTASACFVLDHENAEWIAYLAGWRAAEDDWQFPEETVYASFKDWHSPSEAATPPLCVVGCGREAVAPGDACERHGGIA